MLKIIFILTLEIIHNLFFVDKFDFVENYEFK